MFNDEHLKNLINIVYGIKEFKSYISKEAKNIKVYWIEDIKQNGPATIIFSPMYKKIVVKCQEEDSKSNLLGFNMALVKYLVPKDCYHDCVDEIFSSENPNLTARSIIISHIGYSDYNKLYNKFFGMED